MAREEVITPDELAKHLAVNGKRLALLKNALFIIEAVNETSLNKAAGLGDPNAEAVLAKAHTAASRAIAESDRLGDEERES